MFSAFGQTEESEETLRVTKEVKKKAEEKYKVLENKMKNAEAEREKELKAAQEKLNTAKAKADAFNKKLKQKQQVKPPISCSSVIITIKMMIKKKIFVASFLGNCTTQHS